MLDSFGPSRLADYLAGTAGAPPRAQLLQAIALTRRPEGETERTVAALDIGCGPGREAYELVSAGFDVLAIDAYESMVHQTERSVRPLADRLGRRLEVRQGLVQDCGWRDWAAGFDLIHAGFVLPFVPAARFHASLEALLDVLAPGGVFSGQLFGPDDSFLRDAPPGSMNCHAAEAVGNLFAGLEVVSHEEVNRAGSIGRGRQKWWHVHHVLARRPGRRPAPVA